MIPAGGGFVLPPAPPPVSKENTMAEAKTPQTEPARQSGGSTFAERKAAREASEKRISRSQNKAVQGGEEK